MPSSLACKHSRAVQRSAVSFGTRGMQKKDAQAGQGCVCGGPQARAHHGPRPTHERRTAHWGEGLFIVGLRTHPYLDAAGAVLACEVTLWRPDCKWRTPGGGGTL